MSHTFTKSFEVKLLSALFKLNDFINKFYVILKPEYFENKNASELCRILFDYYTKYKVIPSKEIIEQLIHDDGSNLSEDSLLDFFLEVCNTSVTDLEFISDVVVRFAQVQEFKLFLIKCSDDIVEGKTSFKDLTTMRASMDEVLKVGSNLFNIGHEYFDSKSINERIKSRVEGVRSSAIGTGIEFLNWCLDGGLCKKELGIIVAPPNRGKSISLVHLGKAAVLSGKNVFHYTLEMSEDKIANRYDTAILGCNYKSLPENAMHLKEKLKQMLEKHTRNLIIKRLEYGKATVFDIKHHVDLVYQNKKIKPDMIIVDYGDIMSPAFNKYYNEKRHDQTQIFTELCLVLAHELDTRVWSATQGNKEGARKDTLTMENIAESYGKANVADVILSLCQTVEEEAEEKGRFYLAKMRDAERFKTIYLKFDKKKMSMKWDGEAQKLNDEKSWNNFYREKIAEERQRNLVKLKSIAKMKGIQNENWNGDREF